MAANKQRRKCFVYPVGLTKTLSWIHYGSTNNNNSAKIISINNNKVSTNSGLLHQLQLYQKAHLEMCLMKQKKVVLINVDEEENNFISYSFSSLE